MHHGSSVLPGVTVDAYNAELRDHEGFIGDRASSRAFRSIVDDLRDLFPQSADPLGTEATGGESGGAPRGISMDDLDRLLISGDAEAGGLIVGAIEAWAQEFAHVIRRFLRLEEWHDTQRIVVGGGLRGSRVGELAIGRTTSLLRGEGVTLGLVPIRHDPDQAGLIGAVHLVSDQFTREHDGMVAVDIGGSNMRVGLVALNRDAAEDLSAAAVVGSEVWKHHEEQPDRETAIERLVELVAKMLGLAAEQGLTLAPFLGVGCPGLILGDGTIDRGGQNLPGNWEGSDFNLPDQIQSKLRTPDGRGIAVIMHNDAVVQGLSELPAMRDVRQWGVMTIGTGLGNARFTTRTPSQDQGAAA